MQVFTYTKPHDLLKVYAALAALPGLSPSGKTVSPITVESDGTTLRVTFPDGINATTVAATVAAADATASPPPQTRQQWKDALKAQVGKGATVADIKTALLSLVDGV